MLSPAFFLFFVSFFLFVLLFIFIFLGDFKTEQQNQNASNEQLATLSLPLSQKYDLLEHMWKVYSANRVYITTNSGICQAQTQIQAQCVLRINHKCGVLGFQHNVYSDSSTMCTRI
jgi:hypothetical protein